MGAGSLLQSGEGRFDAAQGAVVGGRREPGVGGTESRSPTESESENDMEVVGSRDSAVGGKAVSPASIDMVRGDRTRGKGGFFSNRHRDVVRANGTVQGLAGRVDGGGRTLCRIIRNDRQGYLESAIPASECRTARKGPADIKLDFELKLFLRIRTGNDRPSGVARRGIEAEGILSIDGFGVFDRHTMVFDVPDGHADGADVDRHGLPRDNPGGKGDAGKGNGPGPGKEVGNLLATFEFAVFHNLILI